MTSVAVTGADGFAGSHLVDRLVAREEYVVAIVRSTPTQNLGSRSRRMRVVSADINDLTSLKRAFWGVDTVYHLAAVSGISETRQMPEQTVQTNIMGTQNVFEAALDSQVRRVLYTSTCHVAGHDIYASSKRAAEEVARAYMSRLEVVVTRAHNHYGPRQRPEWVVPDFVDKCLRNVPIVVNSPSVVRDFTYVEDIARGYVLAMEMGKPGSFYEFGSGVGISMKDLAEKVKQYSGSTSELKFGNPREQDMDVTFASPEGVKKVADELTWIPTTNLKVGLERTIQWYRKRLALEK